MHRVWVIYIYVCIYIYTYIIYCCLKKNQNAPRPSEHPPVRGEKNVKRLVGGIKGCKLLLLFFTFSALVANPKKLLCTVANPARGLLNRGKKKRSLAAPPPPPPAPPAARLEKIKN